MPSIAADEPQPVGIGGYVTQSGTPVGSGISVTVLNNDTGEYANTTTLSGGLYATSLYATNGDLLIASCTVSESRGTSTRNVDLSRETQWMNITIPGGLHADFTYSPSKPVANQTIQFTDTSWSNYKITSYTWTFGDGETSNERSPIHIYNSGGYYRVTLSIRDSQGNTGSKTKTLYVANGGDTIIPPIQPPVGGPYTIPEMYQMMGLTGQTSPGSITLVVIDTGATHRVYSDRSMTIDLSAIDMRHVSGFTSGEDDMGHGTFTTCEAYYASTFVPGLRVISIKALDSRGTGTYAAIEEAVDMARRLDADVVSMSLGSTVSSPGDPLDRLVHGLTRYGIIVVAAAGNSGPSPGSINSPALSTRAIAVGALHPHNLTVMEDDRVTIWSSRGPVKPGYETKPDVVAGGESIMGPALHDTVTWSGTSLSTPIVAGGVAYMLASNKAPIRWFDMLYWWDGVFSPMGLKQRLVERSLERSSTPPLEGTMHDYGHGLPDIPHAASLLHRELWLYITAMALIYIALVLLLLHGLYRLYRRHRKPV